MDVAGSAVWLTPVPSVRGKRPHTSARTQTKPRDMSRGFVYHNEGDLLLQYHLLNASVFTARHPVEVYAGGERSARIITAIPEDAVISGCVVAALEAAHHLSTLVVDVDLHLSGAFKLIAKRGIGVERIGVSVFQLGNLGDGGAA